MPEKPVQRFTLTITGLDHRVEIREGGLRRTISWYVDDALTATTRSSDEKVRLSPGAGLDDGLAPVAGPMALGVRFTTWGRPRRVTLFEGEDAVGMATIGIGGIDLDPEPGSAAAAYEQKVRDHPRRYAAQHTAAGVAGVVVPIMVFYLLARFAFSLPLPDWDLPRIPWPDLPTIPWPDLPDIPWPDLPDWQLPDWLRWLLDKAKYVGPVVVAYVIARGEIRRRRRQDELKTGLRGEKPGTAAHHDDDGDTDDAGSR